MAGSPRARGLVVGDRLVAQVGKSPLAVALYLGCVRAGVVYVPLNEGYTDLEVDYSWVTPGRAWSSPRQDATCPTAAPTC